MTLTTRNEKEQEMSVGQFTQPAAPPQGIDPQKMYPLPAAQHMLGWGVAAFRKARRNGLRVKYYGKSVFVHGSDLIEHINRCGRSSR